MVCCDLCGNDCKKAFEVRLARKLYIFDSFQCAIQFLAPTCVHCGCKIIGHAVEVDQGVYCSAHCASERASVIGYAMMIEASADGAVRISERTNQATRGRTG